MRNVQGFVVALVTMIVSSCGPKEICFDHVHIYDAIMAFDWSIAPEAHPTAMQSWFFPIGDEELESTLFMFPGRDGGKVRLPYGMYCAVGLNGDFTYWARIRGQQNIETIELLTDNATTLPLSGIGVNTIPRLEAIKDQRMVKSPEMVWTDRYDSFLHVKMDVPQKITMCPCPAVVEISVTVTDIEGFENLRSGGLDATLSGLAEGFLLGSREPSSSPVTIPFELGAYKGNSVIEPTLSGKMFSFGVARGSPSPHILTIYMVGENGSLDWQLFDVTDQIRKTSGSGNIKIEVSGLKIPKVTISGDDSNSGFSTSIIDWNEIDQPIKM